MLSRVQVVPEQWLFPRDTCRANLAMSGFRVLFVVAKDSVCHVLLWFVVLESSFLHYLQVLVSIAGFTCLQYLLLHLLLLLAILVLRNQLFRKLLMFWLLFILLSIDWWIKFHLVWRVTVVVIIVFIHIRGVASKLILPVWRLFGIKVDIVGVLLAIRRQIGRGIWTLVVIVRFHWFK